MKPIKLPISRPDAEKLLALLQTTDAFPDVVEQLETELLVLTPPKGYKVYGWSSRRNEAVLENRPHDRGTREVCAARSKAEVARIVGEKNPGRLWNLGETGNDGELRIALRNPGVVFWKCSQDYAEPPTWHRVGGK